VSIAETQAIDGLNGAGVDVVVGASPKSIVRGTAHARSAGTQNAFGIEVFVYEASVSLDIINAADGTLLERVTAQARKTGTTRENAARDAIKEAAARVVGKVSAMVKRREEEAP
jgi:hypothetical protein